jgi:light-regulated signal transduction histidine kinase (bacteriophytochrome)
MTSLTGDILNRVRRLPKPSNAAEALQPLFEAVSNGMHAIEDLHLSDKGLVDITIENIKKPREVKITITDNGIGLDAERFAAFLTTDTDFKSSRGGRGIGRLLWLDAFEHVHVVSVYRQDGQFLKRSFDLVLSRTDQIQNEASAYRIAGQGGLG